MESALKEYSKILQQKELIEKMFSFTRFAETNFEIMSEAENL